MRNLPALTAILALAAVIAAAGCGSSSDENGTASTTSAEGEAPIGVQAKSCKGEDGEIRVTGVDCSFGRAIVASWHKDSRCFEPEGASRTSCKLGKLTCLGVSASRGFAVTCATTGRSIAFFSPKP